MTGHACVICTRPASIFCESCATLDDTGAPLTAHWYCTSMCQHIDRLDHNQDCANMATEKELLDRAQKAGDVAQALFYTFIEHTWAFDMHSVRIMPGTNGEILSMGVVHSDSEKPSICERSAGGWLFKFPHNAFTEADQQAKHVLLADRHSVWAFVFMHVAIQTLFANLAENVERDIKEVVHYVPKRATRLVNHFGGGMLYDHRKDLPYRDEDNNCPVKGVYRITLKNGTTIALDLAGAQYDLPHETIMLWDDYLSRWVCDIKYRIPLRSHYNKHVENMANLEPTSHLNIIAEQTACFNNLLQNCEFELGFDLKDLASEDTDYFYDCKDSLLAAASDRLLQRPNDLDAELVAAKDPKTNDLECKLPDFGPMWRFDWSKLSDMIKMPGDKVSYLEKKKAKILLKHRAVYKMPGDWKLVFVPDTMPSAVPRECVSENPFWKKK